MLLTKILSTLATNHIKLIGLIDANRIAVRKIMHRNDDDKSQKLLGSIILQLNSFHRTSESCLVI